MVGQMRAAAAAFLLAVSAPAVAFASEVFVINSEQVLAESKVGQHIEAEMKKLYEALNTEVTSEGTPVVEEIKTFREKIAALEPEQLEGNTELQEEGRELQGKALKLRVSESVKAREFNLTLEKALQPVRESMNTIVDELVKEKKIDLLVEERLARRVSEQANITAEVIKRLDAKMTTTPVERQRIPVEETTEATTPANE